MVWISNKATFVDYKNINNIVSIEKDTNFHEVYEEIFSKVENKHIQLIYKFAILTHLYLITCLNFEMQSYLFWLHDWNPM